MQKAFNESSFYEGTSPMEKRRTQVENETFEIIDCYAGRINKLMDKIGYCLGLCSFLYIYIYTVNAFYIFVSLFSFTKVSIFIKI